MNYMGFLAKLRARFKGKKADSSVQRTVHEQQNEQLPDLNRRDLQYAREIGRWESIALQIQEISKNTTLLLERIPERVLTERSFGKTFGRSFGKMYGMIYNLPELFIEQFNEQFTNRKESLEAVKFMEKNLKTAQKCGVCGNDKIVELHHIDGNRENNSVENLIYLCPNHHRILHRGKTIVSTKIIIKKLGSGMLTAEDLGKQLNLSRSRTSSILRDLEDKGILVKKRVGRKVFYLNAPTGAMGF